jgi:hypothetical protein
VPTSPLSLIPASLHTTAHHSPSPHCLLATALSALPSRPRSAHSHPTTPTSTLDTNHSSLNTQHSLSRHCTLGTALSALLSPHCRLCCACRRQCQ